MFRAVTAVTAHLFRGVTQILEVIRFCCVVCSVLSLECSSIRHAALSKFGGVAAVEYGYV